MEDNNRTSVTFMFVQADNVSPQTIQDIVRIVGGRLTHDGDTLIDPPTPAPAPTIPSAPSTSAKLPPPKPAQARASQAQASPPPPPPAPSRPINGKRFPLKFRHAGETLDADRAAKLVGKTKSQFVQYYQRAKTRQATETFEVEGKSFTRVYPDLDEAKPRQRGNQGALNPNVIGGGARIGRPAHHGAPHSMPGSNGNDNE